MTEYEPFQFKFVLNDHTSKEEYSEVHGEYTPHDGSLVINLFLMSEMEVKCVIIHEALHKAITETGITTTENQDHYAIMHIMS